MGEAVVVDLGPRGLMFALNGGDYGANIFLKNFRTLKNGKIFLNEKEYPLFAKFKDVSDPKSIQNVRFPADLERIRKFSPRRPLITFEQAYGAGVLVKYVSLELTDAPVTITISEYLPWVDTVGRGNLIGRRTSGLEWYENLGAWDFKKI